MDLDLWDCSGRKKNLFYNRRNTVVTFKEKLAPCAMQNYIVFLQQYLSKTFLVVRMLNAFVHIGCCRIQGGISNDTLMEQQRFTLCLGTLSKNFSQEILKPKWW